MNPSLSVCSFQSPVMDICIGPWRMEGRYLFGSAEQKTSQHFLIDSYSWCMPAMVRSRRAREWFGRVLIVQHHARRFDCISQTMTKREECSYNAGIGLEGYWVLACAQRRFLGPKNQYGSITTTLRPSWMQPKKKSGTTWPVLSSSLCVALPLFLCFPLHLRST